ncbi:MAG: hypothetical protein R2737_05720 [Candidatus Nanopelagicales bacterium]
MWALRLAGLSALVNGVGFAAFDIPAIWHLAREGTVWYAFGQPTYGNGRFEAHGFSVTVPVLLAFLGTCLLLATGGALLLVPRSPGVVFTLAGIVMCAPFWWGFNLPYAWFNAVTILVLLAVAGALQWRPRQPRPRVREPVPEPGTSSTRSLNPELAGTRDDPRALRRAAWAGAAAVLALVVGVALCSLAGVDSPGVSDAVIRDRLAGGVPQAAAGVGLPVLGLGVALLLWFATGLRQVLDRLSGGDPLARAVVPAAALVGGLLIVAVSLDVSSAITAFASEAVIPDPGTARVLGTAGLLVGLTGLTGGAVMVAVTARIADKGHALPRWAVWASYLVALICLTSFWNGGLASVVFALWVIGAAIGLRRVSTTLAAG